MLKTFMLLVALLFVSYTGTACNRGSQQKAGHDISRTNFYEPITNAIPPILFGDFDGDGVSDTLMFVTIKESIRSSNEASLYNPFTEGDFDHIVNGEMALGIFFGGDGKRKGRLHFLQDSAFFNSPSYEEHRDFSQLIRIIRKGSEDFENWKSFISADGDLVGVMSESSVEYALYFDGQKFRIGLSDDEP